MERIWRLQMSFSRCGELAALFKPFSWTWEATLRKEKRGKGKKGRDRERNEGDGRKLLYGLDWEAGFRRVKSSVAVDVITISHCTADVHQYSSVVAVLRPQSLISTCIILCPEVNLFLFHFISLLLISCSTFISYFTHVIFSLLSYPHHLFMHSPVVSRRRSSVFGLSVCLWSYTKSLWTKYLINRL